MSVACRAKRAGMSVLEMLLSAGLLAMMMALLAQVVVPSMRVVAATSLRSGLQQEARTILDRLERDLRRSSGYGVTLLAGSDADDPVAVAINRLNEATFTGGARWEAQLVAYCYLPGGHTLFSRTWPTQPPSEPALALTFDASRPTRCSEADLLQLAQAPAPPVGVVWLARNATRFTAGRTSAGVYSFQLTLSEVNPSTQKVESLSLSRRLYLRNH